jgi:hypothetical protein
MMLSVGCLGFLMEKAERMLCILLNRTCFIKGELFTLMLAKALDLMLR